MELKKLQTKYNVARRGHKLLKDKRDELMKKFLEVVREDRDLRASVEQALSQVYKSFSVASAVSSPNMLEEALLLPKKECEMEVSYRNMVSVTVPEFQMQVREQGSGESLTYGMAFTSGELDGSLNELSGVLERMIRMAELEKTAQLLAEEIERTRRRVNALEYIMMPQYLEAIKTIRMKLDENERGNTTRLMKIKDMMVAEQMQGKKDAEEDDVAYEGQGE
jgi:V/A-type H+-transporting ATPase subunit D